MKDVPSSLMGRAIELAKKARNMTLPNPRVGAVVFDDEGKILGEGYHQKFGSDHAEVNAINSALSNGYDVKGKNICVTLEPCNHHGKTPPCSDAIINAGIRTVYIGAGDDCTSVCGKGISKLISSGINVRTGIREKECREINPGFHKYNNSGLAFVRLKMAISLNAVMGSTWFTGELARERVHELRSFSDLIITGLGTIKKDNPKFTVRIKDGVFPNRVLILDENLELNDLYNSKELNVINSGNKVIVATGSNKRINNNDVQIIRTKLNNEGLIDLKTLIPVLTEELNAREIMIEAGPRLSSSFIENALDMIDKFNMFVAPIELEEDNKLNINPRLIIEKQEMLENTLAVEGHFDI
jgi:diaminohydroxyphosphoribosylaminopyrimidine deaminase / 5-amino-6-(5-phosphoribosylamino)uracil reductase